MNKYKFFISLLLISLLVSGCGRDLSSSTYTSDSTYNIAFEGVVLSKRNVKITESDRLGDNTTGAVLGGISGGVAGARSNNSLLIVGGAIAGGLAGAVIEKSLGTSSGIEYVVKVDTSKLRDDYYAGSRLMRNAVAAVKATGLVTIVQAAVKDEPFIAENQEVLVIVSEKRSRIIPNTISRQAK